jgi:hypothetical protein
MELNIDLIQFKETLAVTRDEAGKLYFFDPIRKKNVRALPEEMVRQLILHYLLYELHYPINKIQVERSIEVHGNKRRYDIIVFNNDYSPFLLIECKSYKVPLNQIVFDQIAMYNVNTRSPYLWVSNGMINYISAFNANMNSFEFIDKIPPYPIN